jgi:hypothetical protein
MSYGDLMNNLKMIITLLLLCFMPAKVFSRSIELGPVEIAPAAIAGFTYTDNYLKEEEGQDAHNEQYGGKVGLKYENQRVTFSYDAMAAETHRSLTTDTNEIYTLSGELKILFAKGMYLQFIDFRNKTNSGKVYEINVSESNAHSYGGAIGFFDRDKPFKMNLGFSKTKYLVEEGELVEDLYNLSATYKFAYHYGIHMDYSHLLLDNVRLERLIFSLLWNFSETESLHAGLRFVTHDNSKRWGLKLAYNKLFFHDLKAELDMSRNSYPTGLQTTIIKNKVELRLSKPLFLQSKLTVELGYEYNDAEEVIRVDNSLYSTEVVFLTPISEYFGLQATYNFEAKRDKKKYSKELFPRSGNYDVNSFELLATYIF